MFEVHAVERCVIWEGNLRRSKRNLRNLFFKILGSSWDRIRCRCTSHCCIGFECDVRSLPCVVCSISQTHVDFSALEFL